MPNHKSALTRLRSDAAKRVRNKAIKSRMRTAVKNLRGCADPKEAPSLLKTAVSAIDAAARRGAVHRGTADRQKSRLTRYVNSLSEGTR